MNFYKHYLGDYDGATTHLSWDEDQAYTRLLRVYYRLEKPIPADTGAACRLVRAKTSSQRAAVETVLREFFEVFDDGWHQKRADEEIAAYAKQVAHNRTVGVLGGRPKGNPSGNPDETRVVTTRGAGDNPHQNQNQNQKRTTTAGKPAGAYPPEFEATWSLYPRRDGDNPKVRAFKAYRARLSGGHSAEEIRAGVERYAAWVRARGKEGTEVVKQAATFFGPDKAFTLPWELAAEQLEPPMFRREGVM